MARGWWMVVQAAQADVIDEPPWQLDPAAAALGLVVMAAGAFGLWWLRRRGGDG